MAGTKRNASSIESVSALGDFYDRHGARAYGLALAIVHDPSLAEQIVEEAFVRLWFAGPRARHGLMSAWLLNRVHRRALAERDRAA